MFALSCFSSRTGVHFYILTIMCPFVFAYIVCPCVFAELIIRTDLVANYILYLLGCQKWSTD